MTTPIQFLREAIRAVPAVKYAVGIGGIVAVIAIVYSFNIDPRIAFVGTVVVLGLMGVLVVFARMTSVASHRLVWPTLVFTWSVLFLFIAVSASLFTSVFYQKPLDLAYWLTSGAPPLIKSTASQVIDDANVYESLFREYKENRDELEKTRTTDLQARVGALEAELASYKSKVERGLEQLPNESGNAEIGVGLSSRSGAAWAECVSRTVATKNRLSQPCTAILQQALNTQHRAVSSATAGTASSSSAPEPASVAAELKPLNVRVIGNCGHAALSEQNIRAAILSNLGREVDARSIIVKIVGGTEDGISEGAGTSVKAYGHYTLCRGEAVQECADPPLECDSGCRYSSGDSLTINRELATDRLGQAIAREISAVPSTKSD